MTTRKNDVADTPRPNLFLIGAMKSGTTTLHALLAEHPDIFMCKPKEPCYFLEPDLLKRYWPEMWERRYWESEASFLHLFDAAGHKSIIGESSTDYSKLPRFQGVVTKIQAFNPQAKFIYIMRDPIERTLSHYWHMVAHQAERRGMMEALLVDRHYTDVSYYAMQLQPYIEAFGRDRIFTLTFEELKADPLQTVQKVFRWLGVTVDFVPPNLGGRKNVTAQRIDQVTGLGLLHKLRHSRLWDFIAPLVPKDIRSLGARLSVREVDRSEVLHAEAIDYLRTIQQQQTEELKTLIDLDLAQWKTLYG